MSPRSIQVYQVGVICALPKEMLAAKAMLDEEYELPASRDVQDPNHYVLGRVHEHDVVITCLPAGMYGTNSAATVASNMLRTFPGIRFGLMVGIGGGIPKRTIQSEIRLGDVVVSEPRGVHGGVIQHDLGSNLGEGKFERKGSLKPPPTILLTALSTLQAQPGTTRRQIAQHISAMTLKVADEDDGYQFPGVDQDLLACSVCDRSEWNIFRWILWLLLFWLGSFWGCQVCDAGRISRPIDRVNAELHYGIIASGNTLLRNRAERDRLSEEFGAICIEMEAAGLMNDFPCLVIRGICDYADSHKNDVWQKYAAITASAFAKTLLLIISPVAVSGVQRAINVMGKQYFVTSSQQSSHLMGEITLPPAHHLIADETIETSDPQTHKLLKEGIQLQQEIIEKQNIQSRLSEAQYWTDRERECHQSFKKEGSYEEYKNINPLRVKGTCQWVLDHPQYRAWKQCTDERLLWISADPGCGKSVLARSLVDIDLADTEQHSVCYFFFKDNPSQDNLSTALCAILHQLFHYQPWLLCHALPAWDGNKDKLKQEKEEMWRILMTAMDDASAQPVVCILDALDECRDVDRRQLIEKLCTYCQPVSQTMPNNLKFLVTSRPYDSVQRWFEQTVSCLPQIRLRGEEESDQINEEINLVIDQRVQSLAIDFNLPESSQQSLRHRLKQMEHRTYLWLYLAYDEIRATYQASFDIEKVEIQSLPKSVEDAYERLLAKINDKQKPYARRILMMIIGAQRPLTIEEMGLALSAAQAHEHTQSSMRPFDIQRLDRQIREMCGLFVSYNHSRLFLIHQTAKEFLIAQNPRLPRGVDRWKYSFREADAQAELARSCVTYLYLADLENQTVDTGNTDRRVPSFYQYCAEHWTTHLQDEIIYEDPGLKAKAWALYAVDSKQFRFWFPIKWATRKKYQPVPNVEAQHVICMSNHALFLLEAFHALDFDLEARDSTQNTALHWAAYESQGNIMKILLAAGADINARGSTSGTALQVASINGNNEIVRILIDAGADVNAQGGEYGTALIAASRHEHQEVVQRLLDVGADVNMTGDVLGTALQAASRAGNETIVQNLLEAGADVNARGRAYGTALQAALLSGNTRITRTLLDAGADFNAQGRSVLGTALTIAGVSEQQDLVKILLDAGADVNARDVLGNTVLHNSCHTGDEAAILFWLKLGADPTLLDGYGRSSFDWVSPDPMLLAHVESFGRFYNPTTIKMRNSHLLQAILDCIQIMRDESSLGCEGPSIFNRLGHALMFFARLEYALIAFRLQIRGLVRNCDFGDVCCDLCDKYMNVGSRYVCTQCANMDFCAQCFKRYKSEKFFPTCYQHDMLCVPLLPWDHDFSAHPRRLTRKVKVWLQDVETMALYELSKMELPEPEASVIQDDQSTLSIV